MGLRAKLSPREWAAVLVALGLLGMGAWLIVVAVLDPETYSKIIGTITAGAILLGTGGFAAIRVLTKHKPPKVTVSNSGTRYCIRDCLGVTQSGLRMLGE